MTLALDVVVQDHLGLLVPPLGGDGPDGLPELVLVPPQEVGLHQGDLHLSRFPAGDDLVGLGDVDPQTVLGPLAAAQELLYFVHESIVYLVVRYFFRPLSRPGGCA